MEKYNDGSALATETIGTLRSIYDYHLDHYADPRNAKGYEPPSLSAAQRSLCLDVLTNVAKQSDSAWELVTGILGRGVIDLREPEYPQDDVDLVVAKGVGVLSLSAVGEQEPLVKSDPMPEVGVSQDTVSLKGKHRAFRRRHVQVVDRPTTNGDVYSKPVGFAEHNPALPDEKTERRHRRLGASIGRRILQSFSGVKKGKHAF